MQAHHAFWPHRLPHSITVPRTSLWDNLAVNAKRYPDKAALVFLGSETSYRELADATETLAAQLQALVTCPQSPYQSKFQKSEVCKAN